MDRLSVSVKYFFYFLSQWNSDNFEFFDLQITICVDITLSPSLKNISFNIEFYFTAFESFVKSPSALGKGE